MKPSATSDKPEQAVASGIKRLQKKESAIVGILSAYQSKKFLIYVPKGNLISIAPTGFVAPNVKVRLDNKEFDFRNSTSSNHQTDSCDQLIDVYNIANDDPRFHFYIAYSEHG